MRRGMAEKRRRSVVERSFRKMGGRAFLVIVGMVLKNIPSGGGKSSRYGRQREELTQRARRRSPESTEAEKPKRGGASSAPTMTGKPKSRGSSAPVKHAGRKNRASLRTGRSACATCV